jgi:hypothetical protein
LNSRDDRFALCASALPARPLSSQSDIRPAGRRDRQRRVPAADPKTVCGADDRASAELAGSPVNYKVPLRSRHQRRTEEVMVSGAQWTFRSAWDFPSIIRSIRPQHGAVLDPPTRRGTTPRYREGDLRGTGRMVSAARGAMPARTARVEVMSSNAAGIFIGFVPGGVARPVMGHWVVDVVTRIFNRAASDHFIMPA